MAWGFRASGFFIRGIRMYEFKQSVKIDGTTFHLGKHNVPEKIIAHKDFAHFVNCGWIAEVDPANQPAPAETFATRSQRLAKKLAESAAPKSVEPVHEPVQEKETKSGRKSKAEKGE